MSDLQGELERYLALRRGLGFKLVNEGRLLADFVAFADAAEASTITTEAALRWARLPTGCCEAYLSQRLRAVRGFARYLHALDPATEVPPLDLLPARRHRPAPYLYSEQDVLALLAAARGLRPPLRAATWETLIALLACTGIRIGEAMGLDRKDIDPLNGLLRIRDSKSRSRSAGSDEDPRWLAPPDSGRKPAPRRQSRWSFTCRTRRAPRRVPH